MHKTLGVALLTSIAAFGANDASAQSQISTYAAIYDVTYKGRKAGRSQFTVSAGEQAGQYTFMSSMRARGILRLARPNPAVDRSVFAVAANGAITPLEFKFEDGSRKGEDNVEIAFDWADAEANVTSESGPAAIPLEAGVLDRGTLQVAMMRDLARGASVGPYTIIDEDGLKTYVYGLHEEAQTETGIGRILARKLVQQREGSSRSTALWVAPEYGYLPVRIEQMRDGVAETVFLLESLESLELPED